MSRSCDTAFISLCFTFLLIHLLFLCVSDAYMSSDPRWGQRTTFGSRFSPSIMEVLPESCHEVWWQASLPAEPTYQSQLGLIITRTYFRFCTFGAPQPYYLTPLDINSVSSPSTAPQVYSYPTLSSAGILLGWFSHSGPDTHACFC